MNFSVVVVQDSSTPVQHDLKNMKKDIIVDDDDVHVVVDDFRDWPNLPSDVRDLIYTLLFELDQIRFRLTCKAWQCAAIHRPPQFPWLMYSSKSQSKGVFKFFSPISNETSVVKIPKLADALFRCSRFGWLLMSRGDSLFFYHPFISGSIVKLHDFRCIEFVSMSFTAPPTSPDCIVFAYDISISDSSVYMYTCSIGKKWITHQIDCKLPFKTSLCTPVFYKNAFYQLDINGRLGVLGRKESDDDKKEAAWKDLPQPIVRKDIFSFYHKNYIAECDGELVLVFVDRCRGDEIHVFKLDWSKMQWVTVKSLGSKAMFIGETGSLLIETKGVGRAANKIYFPRFVNERGYRKGKSDAEEKEICVFYCLKTCKYHALESKNWIGTRGVQNFAWIETNLDLDGWFKFSKGRVSDDDDDDDDDDNDNDNDDDESDADDDDAI